MLTSRSQLQQCKLCKKLPSDLTSPIEAYSCDLHILDVVQDSQQVTCMTLEDWHQAQKVDPILSLVISRLQDGTLGDDSINRQIHLSLTSSCESRFTYYLKRVSYTEQPDPGNLRRPSFSWFCQLHTEITLKGCHDEVGHLGLECTLDLMCDPFF